jgi:tRNA (guanine37-N1)-methyltransferase
MRIDVVSIFPEYLAPLELSLLGKARQDGLLDLRVHDLRDFTTDKHRSVDDTPYGGGAGMVMKPEPWAQALAAVATAGKGAEGAETTAGKPAKPVLIVPSPAGERFNQALAHELADEDRLVFACGRYEGIDERVIEWAEEHFTVRPMSLGDYVLNGGEVAVLAMVEAIGRLLPGVVGNPDSLVEESHSDGLLEYPVYTKPSNWREREVPAVLLSGNHGKIAQWRRHEQYRRTAERRPDLLETFDAGKLPRADRTAFADLGYDVVDGHLRARRQAGTDKDTGTEASA